MLYPGRFLLMFIIEHLQSGDLRCAGVLLVAAFYCLTKHTR